MAFKREKYAFKIFIVDGHYYAYDAGTNQFLRTNRSTARQLVHWSKSANRPVSEPCSTRRQIEQISTGRTGAPLIRPFKLRFKDSDRPQVILRTLEFVITGACNLNCRYCATRERYSAASGRRDVMTEATATKALSFLRPYFDGGPLLVKFFGGEPLLGVKVVRRVIDTLNKWQIKSKKIIATNGLLLDPPTMDFLAQNEFLTFISLDGPAEIHDAYRRDHQGRGSYARVLQKLRLFRERHPKFFKSHIVVNTVLAPEFAGRFEEQMEHLTQLGIGSHQIHPSDTTPTSDRCTEYTPIQLRRIRSEKAHIRSEMIRDILEHGITRLARSHESYCGFHPALAQGQVAVEDRICFPKENSWIDLEDCQSYAWNILTIQPDGKVSACIEFDRSPSVIFGDVHANCLDLDKLTKFKNTFRQSVTEGQCAACWAIRFCLCPGCYKPFVRNSCQGGWQSDAVCELIKQDCEDRITDFLRLRLGLLKETR